MVGSGAAGMVAALTAAHQGLSTVVVEKAAHYGGSTARSGGGVWIPNNEVLKRDGVTDTPEAAQDVSARDHRRRRRNRTHRHLPRSRPRDVVLRVEEHTAEDVLGPRLLRLLPGGPRRPARRTLHRAETVQRPQARRRPGGPGAAVRQGSAQCRCDAAGLRAVEHAQAASARCAAQPQGRAPAPCGPRRRARTSSAWVAP